MQDSKIQGKYNYEYLLYIYTTIKWIVCVSITSLNTFFFTIVCLAFPKSRQTAFTCKCRCVCVCVCLCSLPRMSAFSGSGKHLETSFATWFVTTRLCGEFTLLGKSTIDSEIEIGVNYKFRCNLGYRSHPPPPPPIVCNGSYIVGVNYTVNTMK